MVEFEIAGPSMDINRATRSDRSQEWGQKALAFGLLLILFFTPSLSFADPCAAVSSPSVGHYRFDGTATDNSASGLDGVLHGGVSFAPGICGQAAVFDGIDDYISIPSSALSAGTGNTIAA